MLVTSSSCDKQKCLQILSNIPRGQNSSLVEDYWMDNLSFLFNFTSVHSFSHSFSSVHPFVLQVFSKNPCVLCTSSSRHSLLTQCLVISLGLQRQQSATNYKVLNVFFSPWFRVVQSFLCNKIMCTQFSNKKKLAKVPISLCKLSLTLTTIQWSGNFCTFHLKVQKLGPRDFK